MFLRFNALCNSLLKKLRSAAEKSIHVVRFILILVAFCGILTYLWIKIFSLFCDTDVL